MAATDKAQTYANHLTTTLLPALNGIRQDLARINVDIEEYRDLILKLEKMQSSAGKQATMVELGAGVYADAEVYDTSKITLDVGLGYHVDMTLAEAMSCSENRIRVLEQKRQVMLEKEKGLVWQIEQFQGALKEMSSGLAVSA